MAATRLIFLLGVVLVVLGLLVYFVGQTRRMARIRLDRQAQVSQDEGAAAPGANTEAQQEAAAAPGMPAAGVAPASQGQRQPGRAAGSAEAPQLRVIELRGQRLDHSGYEHSPYIYAKDDYARYSGKDRPVRLHRYSMSGELLWTAELGYFVDLAELPDGKLFVGGTMKAWVLDAQGRQVHEEQFEDGADIFAEIATAADGTILSLLNQTWLYAFSPGGKFRWKHGPGGHQEYRRPEITPSGVIVLYDFKTLVGLNLQGRQLWDFQGQRMGNILFSGDRALFQQDDDTLACLDTNTGAMLWTADYPGLAAIQFGYLKCTPTANNMVLQWAFQGGMHCLGADGKQRWAFDERSQRAGITFGIDDVAVDHGGNAYVANANQLLSLDPAGHERWRVDGPGWSMDNVVVAGANVCVESETESAKEHLLCFSSDGILVWDLAEMPSVLGPSYYDNGAMVFPEPYDEKANTQRLHVWQP
jgi:outer membrane protein assembly factor BamB